MILLSVLLSFTLPVLFLLLSLTCHTHRKSPVPVKGREKEKKGEEALCVFARTREDLSSEGRLSIIIYNG